MTTPIGSSSWTRAHDGRHAVGAGGVRREGEIRDEDVHRGEGHQHGQAGGRSGVGQRRQAPAARPLGGVPELAERQEGQTERERRRSRDAGHHRSRVAAGEADPQTRGEPGAGERELGEPEDEKEACSEQAAPDGRDHQRESDRRRGRERGRCIPAAGKGHHRRDHPAEQEHAQRPGDEPPHGVAERRTCAVSPTAVQLERDLAGDARLEGERRHGGDQRDHDQRDEHRVLRRREHAGQRDLEQGVQAVGGERRKTDEETRPEQRPRGGRRLSHARPRRHVVILRVAAALLWPQVPTTAGRGRSGTVLLRGRSLRP